MRVGIEALNFYGGAASIQVKDIFQNRGLDMHRFNNLLLNKKSVGLACEDSISCGVNAAKPIIDRMQESEKNRIEMVITSSESGIDFGKSISTYIHEYLGLSKKCRLFEVKQACYGGTAAMQNAINFVASSVSPGAKVLVIMTDVARAAAKKTYAEPSQGIGAIAMIVSDNPKVMEMDFGANGYYGYEVMDTCRPTPEIETGDADVSLLSYLDCLDNSFKMYCEKVENVDFTNTFDYLVFHTPFAGMVKGAHRKMMRDLYRMSGERCEDDFKTRVEPSLKYCVEVGNVYSATLYLALCGLLDSGDLKEVKRIGMFSYGSGCSSEFFSGLITPNSQRIMKDMNIESELSRRYEMNFNEYDDILDQNMEWLFGIKDKEVDMSKFSKIYRHFFEGKGLLYLTRIKDYHREYAWS